MTYIVAGIFARGGSKGLPGKNVRMLNGKPLIGYAIECAKQSKYIDYVFVSTDDEEIAQVAKDYGADIPFMRPDELATDTASERMAWRHAIDELQKLGHPKIDAFVTVPATAPLRLVEDLDRCIETFNEGNTDIVITVTETPHSPYYTMVTLNENKNARLVIEDSRYSRRQDAPSVFGMTSVAYVAQIDYVLNSDNIFDGTVKAVFVPPERAIDIDNELDFKLAEILLHERNQ
jgi:N,N'-diacetyl-8-epilegionaminate cytidylyltransferase